MVHFLREIGLHLGLPQKIGCLAVNVGAQQVRSALRLPQPAVGLCRPARRRRPTPDAQRLTRPISIGRCPVTQSVNQL